MVVVFDVELNLAGAFLFELVTNAPISRTYSHPAHPAKFIVNHEAKSVRHVWLVSDIAKTVVLTDPHSFLNHWSKSWNELGVRAVHFEEFLLRALVVHDWVFFNELDFKDGVSCMHLLVKVDAELLDLFTIEINFLDNVDVEIGGEVVHVSADWVALGVYTEQSNHGFSGILFLI